MALNDQIRSIFEGIKNEVTQQLDGLKSYVNDGNDILIARIKYIEDELEIRVESIKMEITIHYEKLLDELKSIKEEILKVYDENLFQIKNQMLNFEKMSVEMADIQCQKNMNEIELKKYTDNLVEMKALLKDLNRSNCQLDFSFPPEEIPECLLGKLIYKKPINYKMLNIKKFIENSKCERVELDFKPWDFIELFDNSLVFVNREAARLEVYDRNLQKVKVINKINQEPFKFHSIATDASKSKIYLSTGNYNKILMVDAQFNFIKSIGSAGSANAQFKCVFGICYKNGRIYACDSENNRIQIFTEDLVFVATVPLEYRPWLVKANETVMFVETDFVSYRQLITGTCIYSLSDYSLLRQYNHEFCRISEIDSNFYEFNAKKNLLHCYDEYGVLAGEKDLSNFHNATETCWDGFAGKFGSDQLLMTYYSENMLLRFRLNS